MSFSGSARRVWRITDEKNPAARAALVALALLLIALAWCAVAIWYCLCLLFFVPFIIVRLFRRSTRKDKAAKLRHPEMLTQMEAQSQASSTEVVKADETASK